MTTRADLLTRTQHLIERIAGASRTPPTVGPSTPLGDGYWLDSIELLDVIVACESEFEILFDDLPADALATLGSLTDTIAVRLRERQPS